ncbi:MAG TPA: hypothetical protein VLL25_03275, partial [Acidimicrobiales bacterium]|nr:hypothetical protein [Acidimicrobiales bacterium]
VEIYTPGSTAGVPLNIVGSLAAPRHVSDVEVLRDEIQGIVTGLLGLVGVAADPLSSREFILLANLLEQAWTSGRDLDLATLVGEVQDPRRVARFTPSLMLRSATSGSSPSSSGPWWMSSIGPEPSSFSPTNSSSCGRRLGKPRKTSPSAVKMRRRQRPTPRRASSGTVTKHASPGHATRSPQPRTGSARLRQARAVVRPRRWCQESGASSAASWAGANPALPRSPALSGAPPRVEDGLPPPASGQSAQNRVDEKAASLEDLQQQMDKEITQARDRWDDKAGAIETVDIPLAKSRISVTDLFLVWIPTG